MQERPDNVKEEDLTPNQLIEDRAAKTAESMGLKLVAAQSNVEGPSHPSNFNYIYHANSLRLSN